MPDDISVSSPEIVYKKQTKVIIYLILSIIMAFVSVFNLFTPIATAKGAELTYTDYFYLITGSICTIYFVILFAGLLFKVIAKNRAIVLTEKGLYDFMTGGTGIGFIETKRIKSIKIFGTTKHQLLGIDLDAPRQLIKGAKRKAKNVVLLNLDMGLPHIIIAQKDITIPVKELAQKIKSLETAHVKDDTKEFDKKNPPQQVREANASNVDSDATL